MKDMLIFSWNVLMSIFIIIAAWIGIVIIYFTIMAVIVVFFALMLVVLMKTLSIAGVIDPWSLKEFFN